MELIGGKTLQEIQDLPLSQMHKHMRQYVDPKWQSWSDTDGKIKSYHVLVSLMTTEQKEFDITAHSEEEADEKARDYISDNYFYEEYEIDGLEEINKH